ncbi:hypothetical protein [Lacticaseibacillus thailandensis]|uniref:hypothetical protein n=1 Tax=Lacticaseibacillus thailandensis TaxID=381741 RepID=UPI000AA20B94|nr:hypothetical protein [Lacticaseibacillus thailandensis]
MKNEHDRRVIRTQHAIKQAFEEMVLADHDGMVFRYPSSQRTPVLTGKPSIYITIRS